MTEVALEAAQQQVAPGRNELRAYERAEWSKAELEGWGGTRRRQKSPWEPAGRKTKLNKGLTLQVAAGAGRGRFGTFLSRSRTCFSSK